MMCETENTDEAVLNVKVSADLQSDLVSEQKHCVTSSAAGWKIFFAEGTKVIINSSE